MESCDLPFRNLVLLGDTGRKACSGRVDRWQQFAGIVTTCL